MRFFQEASHLVFGRRDFNRAWYRGSIWRILLVILVLAPLRLSFSGELHLYTWTVTGDDGYDGQASYYDFRLFNGVGDTSLFYSYEQVALDKFPPLPMSKDSVVIYLETGVWSLMIRVGDEAFNWSAVSNLKIDTVGIGYPILVWQGNEPK